MLRIAIAEDETIYQENLTTFLRRYGNERSIEMEITLFSDGKSLVEGYQPIFDVILLDIKMPDMDGMAAAEAIRQRDDQVVLVFITQMAQYAIHGYEVGALDFLLKPLTYELFAQRFTRVLRRVESREGGEIVLPVPGGLKRLQTRYIYYVEIQNHMLHYHTIEGEYVVRGTMQNAEQQLVPYSFARCNHWYLVNLLHVSKVERNHVTVAGKELEISRRIRSSFLAAVANYLGGNT